MGDADGDPDHYRAAVPYYRRGVELHQRLGEQLLVTRTQLNLAQTYIRLGRDREARALIRRNVETLGLTGVTKIFRRDATELGPAGRNGGFTLVFLDPPYGQGLCERALAAASPERDFGPRSPDDLYMLYTGGTTGMPKGVMWRHEDIFFAAMGGNGFGGSPPVERPEDLADRAVANGGIFRNLVLPPLMHGAAQWGGCNAIIGLFGGGTMVLYTAHGFDPHATWELAERERVTGLTVVGEAATHDLGGLAAAVRDVMDSRA